jgi:hypothetical protein
MTWKELLAQGRVEQRAASGEEVRELRSLVERSLSDSRLKGLSTDGKFGHAYDAARALSTMIVRASRYRVRGHGGAHYNTFLALEAVDPRLFGRFSAYFNTCREKRNEFSYTTAGVVTETEAVELLRVVEEFDALARDWIGAHHPEFGKDAGGLR